VFLRRGGRVFPGLYAGCLAVNLALNWLLIPLGGGMGAALATLGAFVVYGVGLLALAEPTDLAVVWGQWRSLALAVGCSLGMGAALLAAAQTAFFSDSVLLVPLGILVYTLLLGGSGLVSREEWALIAGPLLRLWRPVRPGT
ncbi:MAG: hypothetical protein FJ315_05160, partial [SAR202 cluster bacterium]|nr:hypothetical protein [SAR202 cluster bacterium]